MTTFRIQPKAETLSNSQWNSYPDVCRKNILLVNARDETQATKLVEAKYRTASKKTQGNTPLSVYSAKDGNSEYTFITISHNDKQYEKPVSGIVDTIPL